jgi:hypothetical protein
MKDEDWSRLCRTINQNKCILFIGQEFPVYHKENGTEKLTNFNEILSKFLISEIEKFESVPERVINGLKNKEFSQISREYIKYKHLGNKELSRDDLGEIVSEYFANEKSNFRAPEFSSLIKELPITFIVDTNFSNFFLEKAESNKNTRRSKSFTSDFYNFKGDYKEMVESDEDLGNLDTPFFYNLFGHTDKLDSMVLSEYEWIEFVISLISKNPGLPKNVKSQLVENDDRYFLFIGFGILSRNWYFRILMQALASFNGKKSISYALDYIDDVEEADPSVMFFKEDLKVGIYKYDPKSFIKNLIEKYAEKYPVLENQEGEEPKKLTIASDAPKAFISYKREDHVQAKMLYDDLRQEGIDVFIDTEKIEGDWKESILKEINDETQAFILLQSKNLKQANETEVYREIHTALDRSKRFPSTDRFVFLGYLDHIDSMLTEPSWLTSIHSHDLSSPENRKNFVKIVKRACVRNMKQYGGN